MNDYPNLLVDSALAGVFEIPTDDLDTIIATATAHGQIVYRIDLRKAQHREELLTLIGAALDFPPWYGNNFDGLVDCLCDMGWQPAAGYVVIMQNCHNIATMAPSDFNMLLDIFADVADAWRDQDKPFWCFVDMPANT